MRIYITNWNGTKFEVPYVPKGLVIPAALYTQDTFQSIKGPITLNGSREAREISWEAFFPLKGEKYTIKAKENPDASYNRLQSWINDGRPLKLTIINGMNEVLNMPSKIIQLTKRYDPFGRIHYSIAFREYF